MESLFGSWDLGLEHQGTSGSKGPVFAFGSAFVSKSAEIVLGIDIALY